MGNNTDINTDVVELSATDGVAFIEQASPLTRLHYFDGKFLRADALALEQDYHRTRVRLANVAGGWGVVHGLGVTLTGDQLGVGAGLAVTAAGSFVLATADLQARIADLLAAATPAAPAGSAAFADCLQKSPGATVKETAALAIYEITVGPVEGLCGNEPVYGKLCDSACASDSSHPFWREGVVLRLRPVTLSLPVSAAVLAATAHLRNRIASAYFAAEPWLTQSALSAAGLASGVWCAPASAYGRDEVVIGLLAREAGVNRVIDAWSGRRERMDTQPRGYWQGRMAMRPWNVFVAQILQFQCQLSGLFSGGSTVILPADDCDAMRALLTKTRAQLEQLVQRYGSSSKKILARTEGRPTTKELNQAAGDIASSFADIEGLSAKLAEVESGKGALPKQRMLLAAGFFDLPPAGYLPLDASAAVEDQTQRMFGEGVKLHYHAVRHDEIAHLVEEAQHLERISLTRGLDDPARVEQVEIFVPDGQVRDAAAAATGTWWRVQMLTTAVEALSEAAPTTSATPAPAPAPVPSPAPAPAPVETADKTAAPSAVERVNTDGVIVRRTLPPLDGLVRTEGRDDASFGFTLVAAAEATTTTDQSGNYTYTRPQRLGSSALGDTTPALQLALYLAGDIARDPFVLPVGGTATVQAELASMLGDTAGDIQITGTLTVLALRTLPSGGEERLVQLSIQLTESEASKDGTVNATRMRLLLQREGDGRTGEFVVDDEQQDPKSSPVTFEWDDSPRRAAMFVLAANATSAFANRIAQLRGLALKPSVPADPSAGDATTRQQLLSMTGLAAMPDPSSNVGAAAVNALVALADGLDDAAFLLRARQRLLPTLDAPKTQTVRALDDWVMFRRARTHLCAPACATVAAVGLEAFTVWHLRFDDEKALPQLAQALDDGDEKTLAALKFTRVGVLHYRDESSFSEESADRVLALWNVVQPGPKVALGRVWETAPPTGQGWQNHFRLRNMLQQIASITQPPDRGSGALAAIGVPSRTLDDGAFDGGMLVVTSAAVMHLNALLIYSGADGDSHYPSEGAPNSPMQFDDNVPAGNALANFIAGLGPNREVRGLTLAVTSSGAIDASILVRQQAVVAALVAAGRTAPDQLRTGNLLDGDRTRLSQIGIDASGFDEIVFFE